MKLKDSLKLKLNFPQRSWRLDSFLQGYGIIKYAKATVIYLKSRLGFWPMDLISVYSALFWWIWHDCLRVDCVRFWNLRVWFSRASPSQLILWGIRAGFCLYLPISKCSLSDRLDCCLSWVLESKIWYIWLKLGTFGLRSIFPKPMAGFCFSFFLCRLDSRYDENF